MRRFFFPALLTALALPASAFAIAAAPGDGTLSVRDGDGALSLNLNRGAVIGRVGSGQITVVNPNGDCASLRVWDDGDRAVPEERYVFSPDELNVEIQCRFKGQGLRFRLAALEAATFRFKGTSISLSAVGKGNGSIKGSGGFFDGLYALNGDDYGSLPDDGLSFRLAARDTGS